MSRPDPPTNWRRIRHLAAAEAEATGVIERALLAAHGKASLEQSKPVLSVIEQALVTLATPVLVEA